MTNRKKEKFTEAEILARRERYGIPNWKKKTEYEYIKSLTIPQLNWEFLRRKDWYRHVWENSLASGTCEKVMFGMGRVIGDTLTSPCIYGKDVPKNIAVFEAICRGHPIHPLNNPATGEWPPVDIDDEDEYNAICLQFGEELLELYDAQNIVIGFSPFLSIEPQIANAKKILEETQAALRKELAKEGISLGKKRTNKASDIQIRLLRLLDARGEGVSYRKIGEQVYDIKGDYGLAASEAYKHHKIAESYEHGM